MGEGINFGPHHNRCGRKLSENCSSHFRPINGGIKKTKRPCRLALQGRFPGGPSGTRTLDTLIKSQVLWPTELMAHATTATVKMKTPKHI